MKKMLNSVLGISLLVATSAQSTVVFAANDTVTCSCVTASANQAPGKITAVTGDVLQSGKTGYTLASEGTDVSVGSLISVGSRSAAKVSFGSSCSVLVPANSELRVSFTENAAAPICASITSTGQKEALKTTFESREAQYGADLPAAVSEPIVEPAAAAVTDGGLPIGYLLLGAAVLGGVGYGIFELVDDDDDDDAPGDAPATP
ncbi:MAG: hypothetical protein ABJN78_08090 [Hyphomicrobiales bacterium]